MAVVNPHLDRHTSRTVPFRPNSSDSLPEQGEHAFDVSGPQPSGSPGSKGFIVRVITKVTAVTRTGICVVLGTLVSVRIT
jgi:hypothetical protein